MLTSETYHGETGHISKSGLDLINQAPALYYEKYFSRSEAEKEAAHFAIGRAFHRATTEPQTFHDYYIKAPAGIDRRYKDGKEAWERFLAASAGKTILAAKADENSRDLTYNQVVGMAAAARAHKRIGGLLRHGYAEQIFTWRDAVTGAPCKAMVDWITDGGDYVVDLKSTKSAHPKKFRYSALDYRYHVQAAFYLDGLRANGITPRAFIFLAVEKRPPYIAEAYYLDAAFIQAGREAYRGDLATYMRCRETGIWPGYTGSEQLLTMLEY